jgi:hypothetical protein
MKPLPSSTSRPTPTDREPLGRNAPLAPKSPREQKPDSRAQEEQRDTGMSGKSNGT